MMRFWMVLCAAMLFTAGASAQNDVIFKKSRLVIESGSATHEFNIELAITPKQLTQGLMYRQGMADDAGMLFVHRRPAHQTMWMKKTLISLDMLFIATDGRIVHIAERAVPLSTDTIGSRRRVKAVLELKAGTVSRLDIKRGDKVVHELLK